MPCHAGTHREAPGLNTSNRSKGKAWTGTFITIFSGMVRQGIIGRLGID